MSSPRDDEEAEILQNAYEYWSSGQASDEEAIESGATSIEEIADWCLEELIAFDVRPSNPYRNRS